MVCGCAEHDTCKFMNMTHANSLKFLSSLFFDVFYFSLLFKLFLIVYIINVMNVL